MKMYCLRSLWFKGGVSITSRIIYTYEDSHKEIDNVLYKLCNKCNEWFPCTEEYFYKNNKNKIDGLYPYCKECTSKKSREWYEDNLEYSIQYRHDWNQIKEVNERNIARKKVWRNNNKEKMHSYLTKFQQDNKEKCKEYNEKRQSKNHKINKQEWESCKKYFNYKCAYCGLPIDRHYITYRDEVKLGDFHKEHVDYEGNNDLSNCVPSCRSCNSSKGTKNLYKWYNANNEVYADERLEKIHKWLNEDYKLFIKN